MKIAVLDRESIGLDTPFDELETLGELVVYDMTDETELENRLVGVDVVIVNKVKITAKALEHADALKLICVFATGYDNIDVDAAAERGIAVCNVPGYSRDSVTVFTVATVLDLLTHLREYGDFVKSGEYSSSKLPNKLTPVYHELAGKTWGIVGCGDIGGSVARVATAFGARVITYQRNTHPQYATVSLNELCERSDIITVHCPLNDSSRGIIGEEALSKMKSTVILVNSARGAVLDEKAVANAVLEGRIGAFGCDVYSVEPFDKSHPYYQIKLLSNVLLTPHAAWCSFEARVRCIKIICNNILDYLIGKNTNRVDISRQK